MKEYIIDFVVIAYIVILVEYVIHEIKNKKIMIHYERK